MVDLLRSCPRCGKPDPGERHVPQCATLPEGTDPTTVLTDVTAGDGKYRFIYHMDAKPNEGYRHGVPHMPTQEVMSRNCVRALIERVAELEQEKIELQNEVGALRDEIAAAAE